MHDPRRNHVLENKQHHIVDFTMGLNEKSRNRRYITAGPSL